MIKQSNFDRTQVMDGSLTFDIDYMVFVAPNPQQADKFFALVYPLDTTVWLFILLSFILAIIAFVSLSKTEEMVIELENLLQIYRNIVIARLSRRSWRHGVLSPGVPGLHLLHS